MTALDTFERDLIALVGNPTELRPLVCEGSPLQCKAFVVGFNPATEMSADFWSFWRPGYGFDKAAWFDAYLQNRQDRPLRPGRIRRKAVSNTRRVIEWILEEANPVQCLETNICSAPTAQAADLGQAQRLTAPFDFLLDSIKPKVVVVHGNEAAAHLQARRIAARLIVVPHFSRGWSQAKACALGHEVRVAFDA